MLNCDSKNESKNLIHSENLIYTWRVKAMLKNVLDMVKHKRYPDEQMCDIINGYIEFADEKDDAVITHYPTHDTILVNNK